MIIDRAIPEKKKNTGVEGILFWKAAGCFFCFTPGNSTQNKAPSLEIIQNCVRSLGNSKAKAPRPLLEIPHYFFLVTLVNSLYYFIDVPGNSIFSPPPLTPFSYLSSCKLRRFLRAWIPPAVQWNFGIVANTVYIMENLSSFFL